MGRTRRPPGPGRLARPHAGAYGLECRIRFYHANGEELSDVVPIEPFDLVYSFGVIHHTPHPERVVQALRHYLTAGGTLNVMVYHRYSWKVLWILMGYGKGRFWKLPELVAEHSEAQSGCQVTYTYSRKEGRRLLTAHGFHVTDVQVITSFRTDSRITRNTGTVKCGISVGCPSYYSGPWSSILAGIYA